MRSRARLAIRLAVWFGCGSIALSSLSRPAFAADDMKIFAHATVAPIDRLDAAFARAGFPGFGNTAVQMLGSMGLVTADQVDRSKPASTLFVAGEAVTQANGAIIVLPVKAGQFTLADLGAKGGTPVAGHADAVELGNYTFRRTAGYLMFGAAGPQVLEPTDANIDDTVKDETTLAKIEADVKLARETAPNAFNKFLDSVGKDQGTGKPGEEAGRQSFADTIRSLDYTGLTILTVAAKGDEPEDVALDLALKPIAIASETTPTFTRPAFPSGMIARFDSAFPSEKSIPAITSFLSFAEKNGDNTDAAKNISQAEKDEVFSAITDLLVGDATSVAVEPSGNDFTIYAVIQHAKPAPLAAKLDRLEKAVKAVDDAGKEEPSIARTERKEGQVNVTRLVLGKATGGKTVTVDLAERENDTLIAVKSEGTDDQAIQALYDIKPAAGADKISALAEMDADLPAIGKLIQTLPDGGMPPEAKQMLTDMTKAGHLHLMTHGEGDSLTVRLSMPLVVIGKAMSMTGIAMQGPAGANP